MVEVPKSQTEGLRRYPTRSWEDKSWKALGEGEAVTSAKRGFRKRNQTAGSWVNCIPTVTHSPRRIMNYIVPLF